VLAAALEIADQGGLRPALSMRKLRRGAGGQGGVALRHTTWPTGNAIMRRPHVENRGQRRSPCPEIGEATGRPRMRQRGLIGRHRAGGAPGPPWRVLCRYGLTPGREAAMLPAPSMHPARWPGGGGFLSLEQAEITAIADQVRSTSQHLRLPSPCHEINFPPRRARNCTFAPMAPFWFPAQPFVSGRVVVSARLLKQRCMCINGTDVDAYVSRFR